jgi:predicted GNAT family acetyltransferase
MLAVKDNPEAQRYEGWAGPDLAGVVDYHLQPGLMTILHTEVARDFEGKGVGSLLVARALDDVRARGLKVLVVCPFVRAYIQRHPEYADLVGIA